MDFFNAGLAAFWEDLRARSVSRCGLCRCHLFGQLGQLFGSLAAACCGHVSNCWAKRGSGVAKANLSRCQKLVQIGSVISTQILWCGDFDLWHKVVMPTADEIKL